MTGRASAWLNRASTTQPSSNRRKIKMRITERKHTKIKGAWNGATPSLASFSAQRSQRGHCFILFTNQEWRMPFPVSFIQKNAKNASKKSDTTVPMKWFSYSFHMLNSLSAAWHRTYYQYHPTMRDSNGKAITKLVVQAKLYRKIWTEIKNLFRPTG